MTRPNNARFQCACLIGALLVSVVAVSAQEVPTILLVDVENFVVYYADVADTSKLARTAAPVATVPAANFITNVGLADVTAINGSPAMGVMVMENQHLALSPAPPVGGAIADVNRTTSVFFRFEFVTPDGQSIGGVFAIGLAGGPPVPGAPPSAISGNVAIIGGTGAFRGASGTVNAVVPITFRNASQAEDPSMRRINGGGKGRFAIQIWPKFRPEIAVTSTGPIVYHADFSPVSENRPAQRGEVLVVWTRGLGPTRPAPNPGEPFPADPLAVATSPIEVLMDGKASPAINQVGVPGTLDTYRVDFRVPDNVTPGMVPIQISAAWVKGAAVLIPVR